MKFFAVSIALFLALDGASFAQSVDGTPDDQSTPAVVVPIIIESPSVGAVLTSDRHAYLYGHPVRFSFVITNHSGSIVKYQFSTGQKFDAVIKDKAGATVWRSSQNKVFSPLISHLTILSGRSKVYTIEWNQRDNNDYPVPAGQYSATMTLLPMKMTQISGNLLANPNNDPVNLGMPTEDSVESGAVSIKNMTPPVYAKTTFTIAPEK